MSCAGGAFPELEKALDRAFAQLLGEKMGDGQGEEMCAAANCGTGEGSGGEGVDSKRARVN